MNHVPVNWDVANDTNKSALNSKYVLIALADRTVDDYGCVLEGTTVTRPAPQLPRIGSRDPPNSANPPAYETLIKAFKSRADCTRAPSHVQTAELTTGSKTVTPWESRIYACIVLALTRVLLTSTDKSHHVGESLQSCSLEHRTESQLAARWSYSGLK
jgi:hypothetical protein